MHAAGARSLQDALTYGVMEANDRTAGPGVNRFQYYGPNPPEGATHRYVWTLTAYDASGNQIGQTTYQTTFSVTPFPQTLPLLLIDRNRHPLLTA